MTLQTTLQDGTQVYHPLGNEFQIIKKSMSPERYQEYEELAFGDNIDSFKNLAFGFVSYEGGTEPLFPDYKYIVLNDSGGVFMELSV